jgi:hypothetical protein
MSDHDPDGAPPHVPRNRGTAESKLRRGGKHCPVCLAPLRKNAPRTRLVHDCGACRAHVSRGKHCRKCGADAVWENKAGAACQRCGLTGSKRDVIAPADGPAPS